MTLVFDKPPILLDQRCGYPLIPNKYLGWIARRSATTFRNYAYALLRWLQWCEDRGIDWEKVTQEQFVQYSDGLRGTNNSINYELGRLRRFYEFAEDEGVASPLTRIIRLCGLLKKKSGGPKRPIELVPLADVGLFIRSFPNVRDRLIAELMFLCGLRRCEVLSLPRAMLSVPDRGGKVPFTVRGKGDVERTLQMPVQFRNRLAEYAKTTTGACIFSRGGKTIHPNTIEKAFADNRRRTGIQMRPHLLRHMYASYRLTSLEKDLASKGAGINSALKVLQSELGHKHAETTTKYLHLTDAMVASESLGEWQKKQSKTVEGSAA
jgi:site-specific recombinase XerD